MLTSVLPLESSRRLSVGRMLIGLFALSLVVRLGYLFAFVHPTAPISDELEYFEPAGYLASGHGYSMIVQQSQDGQPRPSAYRPPGVAGLLAAVFVVTGPGVLAARLTCILVASTSAPLAFALTARVGSRNAAMLCGVACAVYPSWVYYSTLIQSEAVYVPILLALLLFTEFAARGRGHWTWLAVGLSWGLAALVRPHAAPCAVLVCVILLVRQPRLFTRLAMVGVGVALVIGAWTCRNAIQLGHPVPLATEGGETLLGANNPDVWYDPDQAGLWKSPMAIDEYREHLAPIQNEVDRDREQSRMAVAFIREHSGDAPVAVGKKLWRWLTPITHSGGKNRALVLVSYLPLLLLLGYGVVVGAVRRSPALLMAVAVSVASAIITAVYWGNLTRGRLPLEILWLPWAMIALEHAAARVASRWRKPTIPTPELNQPEQRPTSQ